MRFDQGMDLLKPGHIGMETGVVDYDDGFRTVCARTRIPGVKARMVEGWFGHLDETAPHALWHRADHLVWGLKGRTGNARDGTLRLAHIYLGGSDRPVCKLRLHFCDPAAFFQPADHARLNGVAICARIGLLGTPVDLGLMTQVVTNTTQGCEMQSNFLLGHIESRDRDHPIPADVARALRHEHVTADLARRLHRHAREELSFLSEILPLLYRQVAQDQISDPAAGHDTRPGRFNIHSGRKEWLTSPTHDASSSPRPAV